jgi:hypothetical protein
MMATDFIGVGRRYATTAERLSAVCGLSTREVTKQIEKARKAGVPVCASCAADGLGYFIADDPSDLALYLRSLDRRLSSMRLTRQRLQNTLDEMTGQASLWEV